jgi:hypothetical protein
MIVEGLRYNSFNPRSPKVSMSSSWGDKSQSHLAILPIVSPANWRCAHSLQRQPRDGAL